MLATLEQNNTVLIKSLPIIGSKHTGKPAQFVDDQAGIYWQVLPDHSKFEERLQGYLLRKPESNLPTIDKTLLKVA